MVGLTDDSRTFAELDSGIQRALGLFIPGFVAFRRQVQIEESLIFYILNQEPLGEIGRIELVKRETKSDISTRNALSPSEEEVLRFLAVWKKVEHAEALAILTERVRARHAQCEADHRSIPSLKNSSATELNEHIKQAIRIAALAKVELTKERQVQLWVVVSVVLNRLNTKPIWEIEQDRFSFNADPSTFLSTMEQATRAVAEQGEPLGIAQIQPTETDAQTFSAILFHPEMRASGVGAIVSAESLDDGTTSVVAKASKETWNILQAEWQKIRAELRRREPVQPTRERVVPEPTETATPITVPTASSDSSLGEASTYKSAMPTNVESAARDSDIIATRNRRGKRSHYSQEERDQVVKDWQKTAKDSHSHTLVDFLAERFGDDNKTYKLNVAPRTFYEWRTDFFKRHPKWTPEDDGPKPKRRFKTNS